MRRGFRFLKMLVILPVVAVVVGFVVMRLWNWLMPPVFGLHTISYWQALGLFVLSKLLLGGVHRHGGGGCGCRHGGWRRSMHDRWEKWEKMTPEEREKFRATMREWKQCGRRGGPWSRFRQDDKRQERQEG